MSIDCASVRPLADRSLSPDWVSERMTKIAQKILFRLSCEIDEAQNRERLESASLESLFVVANLMGNSKRHTCYMSRRHHIFSIIDFHSRYIHITPNMPSRLLRSSIFRTLSGWAGVVGWLLCELWIGSSLRVEYSNEASSHRSSSVDVKAPR